MTDSRERLEYEAARFVSDARGIMVATVWLRFILWCFLFFGYVGFLAYILIFTVK